MKSQTKQKLWSNGNWKNYHILKKLGKGSNGDVYKVEHDRNIELDRDDTGKSPRKREGGFKTALKVINLGTIPLKEIISKKEGRSSIMFSIPKANDLQKSSEFRTFLENEDFENSVDSVDAKDLEDGSSDSLVSDETADENDFDDPSLFENSEKLYKRLCDYHKEIMVARHARKISHRCFCQIVQYHQIWFEIMKDDEKTCSVYIFEEMELYEGNLKKVMKKKLENCQQKWEDRQKKIEGEELRKIMEKVKDELEMKMEKVEDQLKKKTVNDVKNEDGSGKKNEEEELKMKIFQKVKKELKRMIKEENLEKKIEKMGKKMEKVKRELKKNSMNNVNSEDESGGKNEEEELKMNIEKVKKELRKIREENLKKKTEKKKIENNDPDKDNGDELGDPDEKMIQDMKERLKKMIILEKEKVRKGIETDVTTLVFEKLYDIASVLKEMHEKDYGHGDLKLENMFVRSMSSLEEMYGVVVGDFGATTFKRTGQKRIEDRVKRNVSVDVNTFEQVVKDFANKVIDCMDLSFLAKPEDQSKEEDERVKPKYKLTIIARTLSEEIGEIRPIEPDTRKEKMGEILEKIKNAAEKNGISRLHIIDREVRKELNSLQEKVDQQNETIKVIKEENENFKIQIGNMEKIVNRLNKQNEKLENRIEELYDAMNISKKPDEKSDEVNINETVNQGK